MIPIGGGERGLVGHGRRQVAAQEFELISHQSLLRGKRFGVQVVNGVLPQLPAARRARPLRVRVRVG